MTTHGDIRLSDLDAAAELYPGLQVQRAVTEPGSASAPNTVALQAQGELRVLATATNVAPVQADFVSLTSGTGSVVVERSTGSADTLSYTRGISFIAADMVRLYKFFTAPELLEYRAGTEFLIDTAVTTDNPEGKTVLLPSNLSADTLILESGNTLSLTGTLSANKRLELVSGQDVLLKGQVLHKDLFWNGSSAVPTTGPDSGNHLIDSLVITARGLTAANVTIDVNASGTGNIITGANNQKGDALTEAILGVDFNGDGDLNDPVNEGNVGTPTGNIDLQLAALPAANFELRAERDIRILLGSTAAPTNLSLTGFVGGLTGFGAADNVRIELAGTGALSLRSGIVRADDTAGTLEVRAGTLTTDDASVFIAHRLDVLTSGAIQANTLVNRLVAASTGTGNITVSEADALLIDSITARDGTITVEAGGNVEVREIINFTDNRSISVKAAGTLAVDYIEAGSSVGAQKTGGSITLDASGRISELKALALDAAGNPTGAPAAFDNTAADLYAHTVVVRENAATPTPIKRLVTAQDVGSGDDLEIRAIVSLQPGLVTTVSLEGASAAGGGLVTVDALTTQVPGVNAVQVTRVEFSGQATDDLLYTVTLGSAARFQAALSVAGITATDLEFDTMLASLKSQIEATGAYTVDIGSDNALTITAIAVNQPFSADAAVRSFDLTVQPAALLNDGQVPVTAAGSAAKQTSNLVFDPLLTLEAGKDYTVNVGGQSYTVRVGDTVAGVSAAVTAGNWQTFIDVLGTRIQADAASNIDFGERTVGFGGLTVTADTTYRVVIGGTAYNFTTSPLPPADQPQVVGETPVSVAIGLAGQINAGSTHKAYVDGDVLVIHQGATRGTSIDVGTAGNSATAVTTVAGVVLNPDSHVLHLIADADNAAFAVGAVSVSDTLAFATSTNPRAQVTTLALPSNPTNSSSYTVRVAGVDYVVPTDSNATQNELRDDIVSAVNFGAGNASAVAAASGSGVTLTAKAGVGSFTSTMPAGITATQTQSPLAQVSSLTPSASPLSGGSYAFSAGGVSYSVTTDSTATQTELRDLIIDTVNDPAKGSTVVASASGAAVLLTAKVANTAFTGSGQGSMSSTVASPTVTQAATAALPQVSQVVFANSNLGAGEQLSVTVAGKLYTADVVSGNDWTALLTTLSTAINDDGSLGVTATIDGAARKLVLTAAAANTPFVVNNAVFSNGTATHKLLVVAGADGTQLSRVSFANEALAERDTVSVAINGTVYSAKVAAGAANWTSVLNSLVGAINGDGPLPVTAQATVTAGERTLTLTADGINQPFDVSGASYARASEVAAGAASGADSTQQAAGELHKQTVELAFTSAAPRAGQSFTLNAGKLYNFSVGGAVAASWDGVLTEAVRQVNTDPARVVTASYVGTTLTLEALTDNTPFAAGASSRTADATTNFNFTGDGVVIIPVRTGRQDATWTAAGNLSVVRLPTNNGPTDHSHDGEILNLTAFVAATNLSPASGSLVVVDALDVGTTGAVTLTAGASMTLGGNVRAGTLTVSAGDDLTLTTEVTTLNVTLAGAGSDFTLKQTGAINIGTLAMSGGDVIIEATGAVNITGITGSVGDITIISDGGITIGGTVAQAAQAGHVKLVSRAGNVNVVLSADTLDLQAAGDIRIREEDALTISAMSSSASGGVDIVAGGTLVIDAAIHATGSKTVTIASTGGSVLLSQGVSTQSGAITLRAAPASGIGIELGAAGDLSTVSGGITLDSGRGSMEFTAETYLDAGTGQLNLTAGGYIQLGKLRSTSTGDVSISAGGVITAALLDGGEGDTDIVAEQARLVVRSSGGIGSTANPIEVQVRSLDLINHQTGVATEGGVAIEEIDDLIIERIDQGSAGGANLIGSVQINTRHGQITVADMGYAAAITTAGGRVVLYAGGGTAADILVGAGAVTLNGRIDSNGGGVKITAEANDLVLGAGIDASHPTLGTPGGEIALRAVQGSVLTDAFASRWARDSGTPLPALDWLLTHGKFRVDVAAGAVIADQLTGAEATLHGVANGDVLVGAFELALDWALTHGKFSVDATTGAVIADKLTAADTVLHGVANTDELRGAGGAYLTTTGGSIMLNALHEVGKAVDGFSFSPLAIFVNAANVSASSTERENVSVVATGAISVGTGSGNGARGGSTDVVSLAGKQTLSSAMDANGEDVGITADDVDITAAVRSAGGQLSFRTIDPTRGIVLGAVAAGSLSLSSTDLGNLKDGFGQLVFGAQGGSNGISVSSDMTLKDDVVFYTDGAGGHVRLDGALSAPSLTIFGSGDTTTLADDATATTGNVTINDSVRVAGTRTITASAGGIVLGGTNIHYLGGDSPGTVDTLTLDAGSGAISVAGIVGGGEEGSDALNLIRVLHATDVSFDQDVTVDGDLVIDATGIVTFGGSITLRNGGDLIIRGASQIVLRGSVLLQGTNSGAAGDIFLEADEIDLRMSEEQLRGQGLLTLRPTTLTQAIAVASPTGVGTTGVLNLDMAELRTLADGFAQIVIGHQAGSTGHAASGSGAVTVGARTDLDSLTFRDATTIYGSTISVADYSDAAAVLRLGGSDRLILDAVSLINLSNEVEAAAITLSSATSSVRQIDAAADGLLGEALRTLDLTVTAAQGVSLSALEVHTVDVVNSGSGAITLGVLAARATPGFSATQIDGSVTVSRLAQLDANEAGAIGLSTQGGSILLPATGTGINLAGGGNLMLDAGGEGADILLAQALRAAAGSITLTAADAITTSGAGRIAPAGSGAISLTAAGTITLGADVVAVGGLVTITSGAALTMVDGSTVSSLGGVAADARRVTMDAVGDITLSIVSAGGSVALTSTAGALRDGLTGDGANLRTASARLLGSTGIGAAAAALHTDVDLLGATNSGSGGLFISEASGLQLASGGLSVGGTDGTLSLTLAQGNLVVAQSLVNTAASGGGIHLRTLQAGAALQISAAVTSDNGGVQLQSAGDLVLATGSRVQAKASTQTIDLLAAGQLTMAADARLMSTDGAQRIVATSGIVLGQAAAGTGTVSLVTAGAITDADAANGAQTVNVAAGALRMQADGGVGSAGNALETSITLLAADAQAGSIFVSEGNGLVIGSVLDVATSGGAALAGATVGNNGAIVITNGHTHDGRLVVDAAVVGQGSGAVLLQAQRTSTTQPGSITINALVDGGTGAVSVVAQGSISQTATGDIVTRGGTVDLRALGGEITMAEGATTTTGGGNLRYAAAGDVVVGSLAAGAGSVSLVAGGSILDNADEATVSADVQAATLRLQAGQSIASAGNALETTVGVLGARAGAAVTVAGTGSLVVGNVAAIGVDSVTLTGALAADRSATTDAALAGVTAGAAVSLRGAASLVLQGADMAVAAGGNVVLQALAGDVVLGRVTTPGQVALLATGAVVDGDAAVDVSAGALLVDAGAAVGSTGDALETSVGTLAVRSGAGVVLSQAGALTLDTVTMAIPREGAAAMATQASGIAANGVVNLTLTTGDLQLTAAGDISSQGGAVRLQVEAGGLTMASGATVSSQGGAIDARANSVVLGQLDASTSGDLTTQAQWGRVAVTSAGAIGGASLGAGIAHVSGTSAALIAGTSVGAAGAALQTELQTLALQAGGPAYVSDASALAIATVGAVAGAQTGGTLVLQAGGPMTIHDTVGTTGSGSHLLLSSGGDLSVQAGVGVVGGSALSLQAAGAALIDAAVTAQGSGATVDIVAGGAVQVGAAGRVVAADQLRIAAGTDIGVAAPGSISTPSAASLVAGGSITGAAAAGTDISASALRLNAGVGIGAADQRLETAAGTVSARATSGGIWLQEADAVTIGDVAVTVQRVGADGVAAPVSDAPQSDLVTTAGNGSIALRTLNGNIFTADGTAPADGRSVTAHGSGTVALSVAGPGAVLDIHNDALTQQGPVVIDSPLRVDGSFDITAGVGGAAADGNITLQGTIDGLAGGVADRLTITSDGGFVQVLGAIGATQPLAGMTISGAGDVSFGQAVHVNGDLLIEASGRVVFNAGLLLDGGTLHIVGASQVVLGDVVLTHGDLLIDASGQISFADGVSVQTGRLVVNTRGDLSFVQDVQVAAGVLLNTTGAVHFGAALTVAGGGLQVDTFGAVQFGGLVQAQGDVAIATLDAVRFDAGLVLTQGNLQIDAASAIGLAGGVQVAGDVMLGTSGAVTSTGSLQISGGGLSIAGAASVVLGATSVTGGDVAIRTDALRLEGPLRGDGHASLQIKPLAADTDIRIGGAPVAGHALQLDGASLSQVQDFASVSIGQPSGGAVFIDAAALAGLGAAQLTVSGSQIDIVGSDTGTLVVTDRVVLQAVRDITVAGRLSLAAVGAGLVIDSGASITLRPDAVLQTRGGDITLQSQGNLGLGLLDTRNGSDLAAAGGVVLISRTGTISDAALDDGLNVNAGWLVMRGRGPALPDGQTTTAAAIDVNAARLDIDDSTGLMLRDTGTDGRTRFNLLSGGTLYQQMVATGGPLRTAAAPISDNSALSANGSAQIAAWLSALRPLAELRDVPQATRAAFTTLDSTLPADSAAAGYLAALKAAEPGSALATGAGQPLQPGDADLLWMSAEALLSDASFGLAQRLEQAWLLGSSSQQPAATGLQSVGSERFDIWEDSLAL